MDNGENGKEFIGYGDYMLELSYDLRYLAKCSTLGQSLLPEFKVIQILLLQGLEHGHDDGTILRTFY